MAVEHTDNKTSKTDGQSMPLKYIWKKGENGKNNNANIRQY